MKRKCAFGKMFFGIAMIVISVVSLFLRTISFGLDLGMGFGGIVSFGILFDFFDDFPTGFSIPHSLFECFEMIKRASESSHSGRDMSMVWVCLVVLLVATLMIIAAIYFAIRAMYEEYGNKNTKLFYYFIKRSSLFLTIVYGVLFASLAVINIIANLADSFVNFAPTMNLVILLAVLIVVRKVYLPMIERVIKRPDEAVSDFSGTKVVTWVFAIACLGFFLTSAVETEFFLTEDNVGVINLVAMLSIFATSGGGASAVIAFIFSLICLILQFIVFFNINKYFSYMCARDKGIRELTDCIKVSAILSFITAALLFIDTLIITKEGGIGEASIGKGIFWVIPLEIVSLILAFKFKETKRQTYSALGVGAIPQPIQEPVQEETVPVMVQPIQEPVQEETVPVMAHPIQEPVKEETVPVMVQPIQEPIQEESAKVMTPNTFLDTNKKMLITIGIMALIILGLMISGWVAYGIKRSEYDELKMQVEQYLENGYDLDYDYGDY